MTADWDSSTALFPRSIPTSVPSWNLPEEPCKSDRPGRGRPGPSLEQLDAPSSSSSSRSRWPSTRRWSIAWTARSAASLDQLKAMGAFENTLIFFLSDNGASAEQMIRGDGHDPTAPPGSAKTFPLHRPGLVQRGQHAVPPAQVLGPRRRHHHAADRPLAAGHRRPRRTAPRSRPPDRPRADDPGSRRAANGRRPSPASRCRRRRARASCRRLRQGRLRDARLSLVVPRWQPRHPRGRLEARRRPKRLRLGALRPGSPTARSRRTLRPNSPTRSRSSKRLGPVTWKSFAAWPWRIFRRPRKGEKAKAR